MFEKLRGWWSNKTMKAKIFWIALGVILLLTLGNYTAGYVGQKERFIKFNNAVAHLQDTPCTLGGPNLPRDKPSQMRGGVVQFTDGNPDDIFCWVEDEGQVWILTRQLNILAVPSSEIQEK